MKAASGFIITTLRHEFRRCEEGRETIFFSSLRGRLRKRRGPSGIAASRKTPESPPVTHRESQRAAPGDPASLLGMETHIMIFVYAKKKKTKNPHKDSLEYSKILLRKTKK